jgi:hypothetical protein
VCPVRFAPSDQIVPSEAAVGAHQDAHMGPRRRMKTGMRNNKIDLVKLMFRIYASPDAALKHIKVGDACGRWGLLPRTWIMNRLTVSVFAG